MRFIKGIALTCFLIMFGLSSIYANDTSNLSISDAYIRAMAPGQNVTAFYFTLENDSETPWVVVGFSAKGSDRTELHETIIENGVAKMQAVDVLVVEPDESLVAKPGGLHGMLWELNKPLNVGDNVDITIELLDDDQKPQVLEVSVPVIEMMGNTKAKLHSSSHDDVSS